MSEVPMYGSRPAARRLSKESPPPLPLPAGTSCIRKHTLGPYKKRTSLISKHLQPGPYNRPIPKALQWLWVGGVFL